MPSISPSTGFRHEDRRPLEVETVTIRIPMRLERRGGRKLIIAPDGSLPAPAKPKRDETMIRALVKAHRWRRRIESGKAKSITDLAAQEGVTDAYVCRLLPLTCLAPDIIEAVPDGKQLKGLKLAELLRNAPLSWEEQRRLWTWPYKTGEYRIRLSPININDLSFPHLRHPLRDGPSMPLRHQ